MKKKILRLKKKVVCGPPILSSFLDKTIQVKKSIINYYIPEYERNINWVNSKKGDI